MSKQTTKTTATTLTPEFTSTVKSLVAVVEEAKRRRAITSHGYKVAIVALSGARFHPEMLPAAEKIVRREMAAILADRRAAEWFKGILTEAAHLLLFGR